MTCLLEECGHASFGVFAALAEFERELISERTRAGLASARARGRKGGRRPKMTPAKLRLSQAAMSNQKTNVAALCDELGITRSTLYRHVSPTVALRNDTSGNRTWIGELSRAYRLLATFCAIRATTPPSRANGTSQQCRRARTRSSATAFPITSSGAKCSERR